MRAPSRVVFGRGSASRLPSALEIPERRAFLVSSPTVLRLHGDVLRSALAPRPVVEIEMDDGEPAKTFATLGTILDRAIGAGVRRDDYLIAAGGGVVTDVAGLAASILLRGVAWYAVPTTLVGMADAAIGGKTAVDHPLGKNLIGTFHAPSGVLIDPELLSTLPARRFREGIVEIFKTLLVARPEAARRMAGGLEATAANREIDAALEEAIAAKVEIVARDPRDAGERRTLNFGHTLGHAIEASGGFDRWTHGEAVALGMAAALRLSAAREGFPEGDADALVSELVRFGGGLAGGAPEWSERLERALGLDKKGTSGAPVAILLSDWGRPVVRPVEPAAWRSALESLRA